MFSDKSSNTVGFNSCWKTERQLQDKEIQTEECSYKVQESQSNVSTNAETQTDNVQVEIMISENVDYDKLAAFLRNVGPIMITELDRCHKSRAFDSYEPLDDGIDDMVKKLHDLQIPDDCKIFKDMYISGLSWFSNGVVIACGYAFITHEDWCDHDSRILLFNISRSYTSPSRTLEPGGCVSSLSAHPSEPSILVAGLYLGEIVIWNLENDDDSVIGSSASLPGSHREPVTQLSWIPNTDTSQKMPLLVSSSRDGRILIWKVGTRSGSLQLNEAFIVTLERIKCLNLDMFLPSSVSNPDLDIEIGINCFSFSKVDPTCFVMGIDGGIILCCSTIAAKPAPVDADVPLKDPIVKAFERHQGAVTSIQCSPHREDKFISCGTDNEIRIYLMEQSSPIHVMHIEAGVIGVEWSLAYSHILATWGNNKNTVDFYDLNTKKTIPHLEIPAMEKSVDISTIHWNPRNQYFIGIGDMCGRVIIWQQHSYKSE